MCDKSRSGKIGRFDKTLVETYRKPSAGATQSVSSATGTTGAVQLTERSKEGKGPQPKAC